MSARPHPLVQVIKLDIFTVRVLFACSGAFLIEYLTNLMACSVVKTVQKVCFFEVLVGDILVFFHLLLYGCLCVPPFIQMPIFYTIYDTNVVRLESIHSACSTLYQMTLILQNGLN